MKVPLLDMAAEVAPLRPAIDAAIAAVIDSGVFIGGPVLEAFEKEVAPTAGARHALGVSSGTDALLVALMAMGVGAGSEVVTTPFSFFATAGAVVRLGARPVFADIDEESFNLDPAAAAAACGARTRAVITVHLYGRPAPLPAVDIPVLEDAAQSLGAAPVRGKAAAISFFPTKNLGAFGDAGLVATDDAALADRIALLRNHGGRPKYYHEVVGGNFRLDAIQAAVLRVKLPHLAGWTAARRANAARYREIFASTAAIPPELRLPSDVPDHIYNQFVIRAPRRDGLRQHLTAAGIGTEIYYPVPFHLQRCFADLGYRAGAFPVAEAASRDVLALPVYPSLTPVQQGYVVDQIAAFYR
jgi:dTDP-4-amino-4,6-dideoxygalactose transaminase